MKGIRVLLTSLFCVLQALGYFCLLSTLACTFLPGHIDGYFLYYLVTFVCLLLAIGGHYGLTAFLSRKGLLSRNANKCFTVADLALSVISISLVLFMIYLCGPDDLQNVSSLLIFAVDLILVSIPLFVRLYVRNRLR